MVKKQKNSQRNIQLSSKVTQKEIQSITQQYFRQRTRENLQKIKNIHKKNKNVQNKNKNKQNRKQNSTQIKKNNKPIIKGKPWSQLQYTLRDQILHALKKCQFNTMLPVQQAAIPLLLKNYDLAVEAQTGSGKTLSFLVPLLQRYLALNYINSGKSSIMKDQDQQEKDQASVVKTHIKYLIISPTRQLCHQTFTVLKKLLQNIPSAQRSANYSKYCYCATGGNQVEEDVKNVNNCIVLIGTVGRLKQVGQKVQSNWLKKVQYLYIDQADRVLKQKGIQALIKSIQKTRRTAMFSATLQTLDQKNYQFYGMRNLAKISLKQTSQNNNQNNQAQNKSKDCQTSISKQKQDKKYIIPKSLTNTYLIMPNRMEKICFLINFLRREMKKSKIIVFFSTCASVDFYTKLFYQYFKNQEEDLIFGLHGKLKSKKRQKIISNYLNRQNGCLFATDVVSRGIDFDHIHYILQIDPPEDPDNYVHRIGRTARINRPGTAILMIENHQQTFINYLQDKSVGVQLIQDHTFYAGKQIQTTQQIIPKIDLIMQSDRDYIQKSKKAFVSYIRSYKEHDLKYIFQFKKLDIGLTAQSFFMYKIPRIKQILGKKIENFDQNNKVKIQAIPWLDKNQEQQYLIKKQKRQKQKKAQEIRELRLKKKKRGGEDIKNNKSKRKKIKQKLQIKRMSSLNKQHKEVLKQRKNKNKHQINQSESEDQQEDDFEEMDTEQIQKRMEEKY